MATWVPTASRGCELRPVTVIRSQLDAPAGTRRRCGALVTATESATRPAAVDTRTCATDGPSEDLSSKATEIVPGSTGESKSTWIHWPAAPVQLPDSHLVRMSPSTAANGSKPLAHWPGMAWMSEADEDAVTFLMPVYAATAWYLSQPGSV